MSACTIFLKFVATFCQFSTIKFKTEWSQRYQDCEDLGGEDRTVKVTLSIVSPRVGHRLAQYHYLRGTTFPKAIIKDMANSRTC
jgi:hypothetical protein